MADQASTDAATAAPPPLTDVEIVRRQCNVTVQRASDLLQRAGQDPTSAIMLHLFPEHEPEGRAHEPEGRAHEPEDDACAPNRAHVEAVKRLREIVDVKNAVYRYRMEGGHDPSLAGAEEGGAEEGGAEEGGAEEGGAEKRGAEEGGAEEGGAVELAF